MQVKELAQSLGYTATIEQQLPEGNGQVDVLLTKGEKTIAVEISVSTGKEWEVHNLEKCIKANYTVVVSLAENEKQASLIKAQFEKAGINKGNSTVHFYTLEAFIDFLKNQESLAPADTKLRGYKVNVSYEQTT